MDIYAQISRYGLAAYIIVLVVVFFVLFFWLMMLIDCVKRNFRMKYLWLALLIIFNIPASWVYYFIVKRPALGMEGSAANRHVAEHDKPVRKKLEETGALGPKEEEKPKEDTESGDSEPQSKIEEPKEEEKAEPVDEPKEEPQEGPTLEDLKETAEEPKTKPEIVR